MNIQKLVRWRFLWMNAVCRTLARAACMLLQWRAMNWSCSWYLWTMQTKARFWLSVWCSNTIAISLTCCLLRWISCSCYSSVSFLQIGMQLLKRLYLAPKNGSRKESSIIILLIWWAHLWQFPSSVQPEASQMCKQSLRTFLALLYC